MTQFLKKLASGILFLLVAVCLLCFSIQAFVLLAENLEMWKRIGLTLNAIGFFALALGLQYLRLKLQGKTINSYMVETKEKLSRLLSGTLHMRCVKGTIVSTSNYFSGDSGVTIPLMKIQNGTELLFLENVVIPYHLQDLLKSKDETKLFLVESEAWGKKKHRGLFACIKNESLEYHPKPCRDALKEVLIDNNSKIRNFGYGGATTLGDLARILLKPIVRHFHFPSDRAMKAFMQEHAEKS